MTLSLEQIPISVVVLFSDEHLEDPYPDYKAIRDAGPAGADVEAWGVCLARYKPVREAVDNWQTFRSGQGVSLNDLLNKAWTGTVIGTDPPYHGKLRGILNERLSPPAGPQDDRRHRQPSRAHRRKSSPSRDLRRDG